MHRSMHGRQLGLGLEVEKLALNPLVARPMGPHINRDTVANIRAAGLVVETEQALFRDIIKLLVCRPDRGGR